MTAYEMRREGLLAYCRIDDPTEADDALLKTFYLASVNYMTEAGVQEPADEGARKEAYNLCVDHMVLDQWDHRGASGDVSLTPLPAFRQLLNQLKLTEPAPEDVSDSDQEVD